EIGTGINMAVNDFNGRLWTKPGDFANNGIDDDNDGYVDNVHGWNYLGSNENGDISDVQGHGTGTAGLIVGNHYTWTSGDFPDGKEYEGIASKAQVIEMKLLNSSLGNDDPTGADMERALQWV